MKIDRSKLRDSGGRRVTQSLFIEYKFNPNLAIYTMDGEDREYNGVTYPSLKKLYLEKEDVMEYEFATTHLYDWEHWQRILSNKWCRKHIDLWREELELKLQSVAVDRILELSDKGNFQASKFIADRGWDKRRGRPSKEEQTRLSRVEELIQDDFAEDAERVANVISFEERR